MCVLQSNTMKNEFKVEQLPTIKETRQKKVFKYIPASRIEKLKEKYKKYVINYNKSISKLEKGEGVVVGREQFIGSIFAYEQVIKDLEELLLKK